ncbi:MAG TPA: glycosyltransferase [Candidatus Portnoybacteria bacterium]|nr:glycosyltransferase [Candidatus Portnoybacteria bacterium]
MKILQVNKLYSPWIGGVEKIVQQISEGLNKKEDFKIDILCCNSKRESKEEEINGIKVRRARSFGIFWGMPISFDFFRLFYRLHDKYDIIDFHHPFPLGDLAIFLFKPKGKLIVHYHSDIVRQKFLEILYKPLALHTLKKAQRILVSNPNLIKHSPYLKKFSQKCKVIPFGVNLKEIEKSFNQDEIEEIKKKYGDFVLFVGRLNYYKGVQYLVEAMQDIPINLVIIGQGKEEEKLKQTAKTLGLGNKVFFLPFQKRGKLINFYRATKVFVLPSIFKSETFGIVLIETMTCGTPIISTELGTGTSWVNINNETGFVIPPKDSQAITRAIKTILQNHDLAQKFSQNAQKRAKEYFSLEKMLKKTEQVYYEVTKK